MKGALGPRNEPAYPHQLHEPPFMEGNPFALQSIQKFRDKGMKHDAN